MSKRKSLKWIAAIGILFVGLCAFALTKGRSFSDIRLASRAELIGCERSGSDDLFQRTYSLHMNYDDAVIAIEKEMAGKGWTESSTYSRTFFMEPSTSGVDYIMVERSRLMLGKPGEFAKAAQTMARGWVTITTRRHFNRLAGMFLIAETKLRGKWEPPDLSYARIDVRALDPKRENSTVDVHSGTTKMESDHTSVIFIVAMPRP